MSLIPANSVNLISGGNVIKHGDETPLTFQLNDETGQPVDLTGATVTARMANSQIVVLTKEVTVNDDNTVTFSISKDETTGHGEMRLEFVVNKDGKQEIFPAQGYQQIVIQPSLGGLDSGYVAVITIEEFERRFNEVEERVNTIAEEATTAISEINQALEDANTAVENANQAVQSANTAGQFASEQGNYAKTQGDIARDEASNLSQLKSDVVSATQSANQATTDAQLAAQNAEQAATNASIQAQYAKEQGDYAKAQAELIDDILDQGSVASVNGKTGNVTLTADDVGAIPQSEKGVAGGVAKLNEQGQVVDAEGNLIEGKVKSVNNIEPDVNGNITVPIPTKTSELENDSNFVTKQYVDEKEVDTSNLVTQQEFMSHKADDTQIKHKAKQIGLEDTDGLFTAVNVEEGMKELFTNVSNGKSLVGGAITDVDDSVVIPTDPTFQQLADAIRQISTGKKIATGSSRPISRYRFQITGLDFEPSWVFGVTDFSGTEIGSVYAFFLTVDTTLANNRVISQKYTSSDIRAENVSFGSITVFSPNAAVFNTSTYIRWFAVE